MEAGSPRARKRGRQRKRQSKKKNTTGTPTTTSGTEAPSRAPGTSGSALSPAEVARIEMLVAAEPNVTAGLLRALGAIESCLSPGEVARLQMMIADTMSSPRHQRTEADWWFAEPPEELGSWDSPWDCL